MSNPRHPRLLSLALALALAPALTTTASAQPRSRHADVWPFGFNCQLAWDADATSVTFTAGTQIRTDEGCATFCDPETGALLLYSDGTRVWNGQDTEVFSTLPGNSSSLHSGVVVPRPGSPGHVFVFGHTAGASSVVSYHEFDLTNGAAPVGDTLSIDVGDQQGREGMLAIPHANGVDYWLLISGASVIHVLPITASGLGADVTYASGVSIWSNGWHLFAASHQGDRVAIAGNALSGSDNGPIMSFDFDPATGALSNGTRLNATFNVHQYYGGVFSPSGRRLYFSTLDESNASSGPSAFYQYDYDSGVFTQLDTRALRYSHGDGRLGPDGKIYVAGDSSGGVHVVADPDAAGTACGFTYNALLAPNGCSVALGLPQSPSPLARVQLDLAVDIATPAGIVVGGGALTASGAAQAPDQSAVAVTVYDYEGTEVATCDAQVVSAAWTCPDGALAALPPGHYFAFATVTYGEDTAYDESTFQIVACTPGEAAPNPGCDAAAPYCAVVAGMASCIPCTDDTMGDVDTGCTSDLPSCDPLGGACVSCADDPSCTQPQQCLRAERAPEIPAAVEVDPSCGVIGPESFDPQPDLAIETYAYCADYCDPELGPVFDLTIAVGNHGPIGAEGVVVYSTVRGGDFSNTADIHYFDYIESGAVATFSFPSASIAWTSGSLDSVDVFVSYAGDCNPTNDRFTLHFGPQVDDVDQDQVPDLCDDCIAAPETCDGVDNDCDEATDEGCDDDHDGFCDEALGCDDAEPLLACPFGCGDCDDDDNTTSPLGVEICNGKNDDCDDQTDEGLPSFPTVCGTGVCERAGTSACVDGAYRDDCAPGSPTREVDDLCNGLDDDCDEQTDEEYA
ncbi:MAG: hypothetical protein KC635_19130, partial [Myxococcales bacterium]|nr:hypothetical protein [Myxococcales bacterium]